MLDDFFVRALAAGIGVALVTGPLGCFVVWRRMAYFGATLSHSALLGIALALLLGFDPVVGIIVQSLIVVPALILLERHSALSSDTHLGILAHGTLAVGLVIIGFMSSLRVDLMGYLFGDILAVTAGEVLMIYGAGAVVIGALVALWRPLFALTVNEEIAAAEGMKPERSHIALVFLLAGVIAIGMKLVGILLILSLLIIPAATARTVSRTPEQMAVAAALIGVAAVIGGLGASRAWDVPAGPAIVVAGLGLFLASLAVPASFSGDDGSARGTA